MDRPGGSARDDGATLVTAAGRFAADFTPPGDKSVSHRALILSALSGTPVTLHGLSPGDDVGSTRDCLRALGVEVQWEPGRDGPTARVHGVGLRGLRAPGGLLECGNSGTTARLLAGVLAGAALEARVDGDASLRHRPMARVLRPLRAMGARAWGTDGADGEEVCPLRFVPHGGLLGLRHRAVEASAQVKSALLLAGLWAEGATTVHQPFATRDHTEVLLRAGGVPLGVRPDGAVVVPGGTEGLRLPSPLHIPGDPSSAAFAWAAAALVPGGEALARGVGLNPSRTAFLDVLRRMGAGVEVLDTDPGPGPEPWGDVRVRHQGPLTAIAIGPAAVPGLIDELPLVAVLGTAAVGCTTVRGASELRRKESDRIAGIGVGLRALGARVDELPDGWVVEGPCRLAGAAVDARADHRLAMALGVAALVAQGQTSIRGAGWASVSHPGFFADLARWTA